MNRGENRLRRRAAPLFRERTNLGSAMEVRFWYKLTLQGSDGRELVAYTGLCGRAAAERWPLHLPIPCAM